MKHTDLHETNRRSRIPSLRELFAACETRADGRKLAQAGRVLQRAFGVPLDDVLVKDPIEIRQRLAEQLKAEGASAGMIQAYEQFFMGVVRRAALDGLVPPPPEGPWTQEWQAVLDESATIKGARAPLRSLAAWATLRGHSPSDLSAEAIDDWAATARFSKSSLDAARTGLARDRVGEASSASSDVLMERLRKKAIEGTVRRGTQYR